MKISILLLVSLIGSICGIITTEGTVQSIFEMAFFGVLILSFLTLTVDFK